MTVTLQKESMTLADRRHLFDNVIEEHRAFSHIISPNAGIIYDLDFESGVIKILECNCMGLISTELPAVQNLKLNDETSTTASDDSENLSLAEGAMKRRKLSFSNVKNKYMKCGFLLPQSNIVKRLF